MVLRLFLRLGRRKKMRIGLPQLMSFILLFTQRVSHAMILMENSIVRVLYKISLYSIMGLPRCNC